VTYLEQEVTLPVNKEKSEVEKIKDVPFLGFQILGERSGQVIMPGASSKIRSES